MAASLQPRGTESKSTRPLPMGRQPLSQRALFLVILLIGLTIVAIVVAVAMARQNLDQDTLWYEIGKLVAQAGILTGFGALVTLLIHEFQQDQEQSRQRVEEASQRLSSRHEWLRDFAARVTGAYTDLKQARRRLQWAMSSTDEATFITTAVYEKQLRRISAVQAEFEALLTLAQTYFLDEDRAKPVETHLKKIADRLSDLVSERKNTPIGNSAPEPLVSLNDRETMKSFTAESKEPAFREVGGFGQTKADYKATLVWIVDELRKAHIG
jgi:flagellar biosynthesis protein FliQ